MTYKTIEEYRVSFCIPVYNNRDNVMHLVKKILSVPNYCIQVVVSDDCSNDGTFEEIQMIADSRLKYVRNEAPIGAKLNWNNALSNGDGKYLYLIMGRDDICINCLTRLLALLDVAENNGIDLVMDRKCKGEYCVVQGINAFTVFLRQEHPTGTIFRNESFSLIEDREKLFSMPMAYPEMYIKNELLKKKPVGIVINSGVFAYKVRVNKAAVKSSFEPNANHPFFFPDRRIQQFHEIIKMSIGSIREYDSNEVLSFVTQKVRDLCEEVTFGYKTWREDFESSAHYGLEKFFIGEDQMISNLLLAKNAVFGDEVILRYTGVEALRAIFEEYNDRIKDCKRCYYSEYKYKSISILMKKYIDMKRQGFDYSCYLKEIGITSIAIYGLGEVGDLMYRELCSSDVSVLYGIDRNHTNIYSDLEIWPIEYQFANTPDAVIVCTVSLDTSEIIKNVQDRFKGIRCLLAEEVIYASL